MKFHGPAGARAALATSAGPPVLLCSPSGEHFPVQESDDGQAETRRVTVINLAYMIVCAMKGLLLSPAALASVARCFAANTLRIYVIGVEGKASTLVIAPSGAADADRQRARRRSRSATHGGRHAWRRVEKIDYLFSTV